MANNGSYFVINPQKPIQIVTPTPTTIASEVANNTAPAKAGWFDFLGNMWQTISPYLPFVLGAVFLLILVFLIISWLKKGDKIFQKDYDKEAYKSTKDMLTRDPARTSSSGFFVVALVTLITLVLSALIVFGLFLIKITHTLSFTPIVIASVVACLGSIAMTMMMPSTFNSYAKIVNQRGQVLGFMLTGVRISSDGFLQCLIFKKTKWLILIDDEILSVPLNKKFEWKVLNKTSGKSETKSIDLKDLPTDKRFWWLSNGDLMVNCLDFHKTKYFIYPLYAKGDGDVYDLSEFALVREMGLADKINQYDLANTSRENAIILSQGNPYKRLQPAQGQGRQESESENS